MGIETIELRILIASAQVAVASGREAEFYELLEGEIDWTRFARLAVDHGLVSIAADVLARCAPDAIPEDILDAFRLVVDQTRARNRALLEELAGITGALTAAGVEAIALKGPILALDAYGDLGLRVFRDLDFLVRDWDLGATLATLEHLGYRREKRLKPPQYELIHRLQGEEILFKEGTGIAIEPHTRLHPLKVALDIDHTGLWSRAQSKVLNGRTVRTLAPEDNLIALAVHGGKEMWWQIKWVCDIAAFIGSHPNLDWAAIISRARTQGCLRMVLLATYLARKHFHAAVPGSVVEAESATPFLGRMEKRICANWFSDERRPPSGKTISMDLLRLHDGTRRKLTYATRTLFMPGPHHVSAVAFPQGLEFAYIPFKIGHDAVALPLWRGYRSVVTNCERFRETFSGFDIGLSRIAGTPEARQTRKRRVAAHAKACRNAEVNPNSVRAWLDLGKVLSGLKRYNDAVAAYDNALALIPDNWDVWRLRKAALKSNGEKNRLPDCATAPQDARSWAIRAGYLQASKQYSQAAEACDRAMLLDPGNEAALRCGIHSRLQSCDWRLREQDRQHVSAGVKNGAFVIRGVDHRSICESEEELAIAAKRMARQNPSSPAPLWNGERYRHEKIRIAYVSSDFGAHPVANLIVGCFEEHNRSLFEVAGISVRRFDESEIRHRIAKAVDRFVDAHEMGDGEIAAMMREMEIDIAVDLNGETGHRRTGIFPRRPAPVQVNYLGFAGTMGVSYMDYIIADRVIIPDEHRLYYREAVAYLPDTYLPADNKRRIAQKAPTRVEAELPDTGFVFACFNNAYKITPEIFDVWMRLLRAVEGSVLWLQSSNVEAMSNLRREAKARDIAPERLVFARRVPHPDYHLARLRAADLFLDTRPYNAHATASDALWAGLPVVTCIGSTFSGRVAASLLQAAGLSELVTTSLDEYEALALALARNPQRLAGIKQKLMQNRNTAPLFDTPRYTRHLESAYITMRQRSDAGLPPESFSVHPES